jgi:hypothetical protein
VARATHLAAQERQRQQLGISPSLRSVDPNCPFTEITLDPGASITVDGCQVVNLGSTRQRYWLYSQDDLRASLGLPRVEVVDERQGRNIDKERRHTEWSRSRKGVDTDEVRCPGRPRRFSPLSNPHTKNHVNCTAFLACRFMHTMQPTVTMVVR